MTSAPGLPVLVTITGPLAAGKNTVAEQVSQLIHDRGRSVALIDVDAVADMVHQRDVDGIWQTASRLQGELVTGWLTSGVEVAIAVGSYFEAQERAALFGSLPESLAMLQVLLHADVEITWNRALGDETRGLSRQRDFHARMHRRYLDARPGLERDLEFDTGAESARDIAAQIVAALALAPRER